MLLFSTFYKIHCMQLTSCTACLFEYARASYSIYCGVSINTEYSFVGKYDKWEWILIFKVISPRDRGHANISLHENTKPIHNRQYIYLHIKCWSNTKMFLHIMDLVVAKFMFISCNYFISFHFVLFCAALLLSLPMNWILPLRLCLRFFSSFFFCFLSLVKNVNYCVLYINRHVGHNNENYSTYHFQEQISIQIWLANGFVRHIYSTVVNKWKIYLNSRH